MLPLYDLTASPGDGQIDGTTEKEGGNLEVQDSAYIKKLHYIMVNFVDLQHKNEKPEYHLDDAVGGSKGQDPGLNWISRKGYSEAQLKECLEEYAALNVWQIHPNTFDIRFIDA